MDINLLLEPPISYSRARNENTTSVSSSLTGKAWTNASTPRTHTQLLIDVTTSPVYVTASSAFSASAPIPSNSPAGPPLQTAKRAASQTPLPEESPTKKQLKWTQEEDNLAIELRGTGMKWDDIAKRIPGRSSISCRLRYQNYLKKRAVWDKEKKNKLARLYARFKDQMWQKVASEMQIPWRSAESMHWQLGEQEMSMRANAPVFQLHPSATGARSSPKGAPTIPHFRPLSVSRSSGSGNGNGNGNGNGSGGKQQQQHHQGQKPGSPQPSLAAAQEQLLQSALVTSIGPGFTATAARFREQPPGMLTNLSSLPEGSFWN